MSRAAQSIVVERPVGREWRCRAAIAAGGAVVAAGVVFPFTARPISWDEWVYMGLAFFPQPKAWVLNRYAHIYALKPFMWLAGDPFVGARAYWSALFGISVGALIWAALHLPADRGRVIGLTLFLFLGQQALFAFPGIAFADYTVMAVTTIAGCLVLARIASGNELAHRDAAALGALFLFGIKAKETALPLLLLAGLPFVSAAGGLRADRTAIRLTLWWAAGAAAAMLAMVALDAVVLHDPLFSVRPSSWSALFRYNTAPYTYSPSEHSWLGLMLRPESFVAFALYLGAGLLWSANERDRRLLFVYPLPVVLLLFLTVTRTFAIVVVIGRYIIPILPLVCLLAALAFVRVVRERSAPQADSLALLPRALAAAALIAVGLAGFPGAWRFDGDALQLYVVPAVALSAFIALLWLRWLPRLAAAVAILALVGGGVWPLARVLDGLARREVQRQGEARFAGFYQVTGAVKVDRDAIVFVSRDVYGGAIREGVTDEVTRLSLNVPLRRLPLVNATWPPPPDTDYAIVSYAEYQRWLALPDATADRAVVSDDRQVALICLRATCPLK